MPNDVPGPLRRLKNTLRSAVEECQTGRPDRAGESATAGRKQVLRGVELEKGDGLRKSRLGAEASEHTG